MIAPRSPSVVLCVLFAAVALALQCAPAARAAPQWLAPFTLNGPVPTPGSPGNHTPQLGDAQVGWDDNGDVVTADREFDGSHSRIAVLTRLRDGTVHKQLLSAPGIDADQSSLGVAVAANGDLIVVWTQANAVYAAVGHAGNDLTVSGPLGTVLGPGSFALAAGESGDLAVAFGPGGGADIRVARRPPGGTLGGPTQITGAKSTDTAVTVTPGGETVVGFTKRTVAPTGRATDEVDWSAATRGGAFSPATAIPGSAGTPPSTDNTTNGGILDSLAVDGAGTAYAVYFFGTTAPLSFFGQGDLRLTSRPAGGTFGAGTPIPGADSNSSEISGFVSATRGGDLMVRSSTSSMPVGLFLRPAGGSFTGPSDGLGGDRYEGSPAATLGPSGGAAVVYRPSDATSTVVARRVALNGNVGPREQLATGQGSGLAVAAGFDLEGDGLAAWSAFDGTVDRLVGSAFDGAGPRIQDPVIPGAGTAGVPLAFSARASDTWAPVSSIDWSFGDGAVAGGANTAHAYGAVGTRSVSVSAVDVLGNRGAPVAGSVSVAAPKDVTAPLVSKLSVSPQSFAAAGSGGGLAAARHRKVARGAKVAFRLSEPAVVGFTAIGKRRRVCRRVHGKRHCSKRAPRYSIGRRTLKGGSDRVRVTGRAKGKALPRGRYTLSARATDGAKNRGKAVTTKFRIVKP